MNTYQRFHEKTVLSGECVNWIGAHDGRGYGQFSLNGKVRRATHVALYLRNGEWPESGKIVCHHCDNKRCVNPEHLYVGTQVENQRDTYERGNTPIPKMIAAWLARTHCHNGHEYTPENTKMDHNGHRSCRNCNLARARRQSEKRKRIRAALGEGE